MFWLIGGLVIFLGVHVFSSARGARGALIGRIGERPYKAVYSILALAGFALIVIGMGRAHTVLLWKPPDWGRYAAALFMPLALVFIAASIIPSNLKRATAHPMLWGVTLWALVHLLSNGDLAGVLLFSGFLLYAVYAMWSQTRRGAQPAQMRRPFWNDIAVVALGLVAFGVILRFHAQWFGVPVAY